MQSKLHRKVARVISVCTWHTRPSPGSLCRVRLEKQYTVVYAFIWLQGIYWNAPSRSDPRANSTTGSYRVFPISLDNWRIPSICKYGFSNSFSLLLCFKTTRSSLSTDTFRLANAFVMYSSSRNQVHIRQKCKSATKLLLVMHYLLSFENQILKHPLIGLWLLSHHPLQ